MINPINPINPIKVLCYKERIESAIEGIFPKPITLGLDISNFCNDDCEWCLYRKYKKEHNVNMPIELIKKAIVEAKELGILGICFSGGGEPLMNEYFNSAIMICKKNKIAASLNTNGDKLNEISDEVISYLTYIRISLDAGSYSTHLRLHHPSGINFKQRLQIIEKICKKKLTIIGIGFLVHPLNYKEIYKIAKILDSMNCSYLQIRPLKNIILSKDEKNKVFTLLEKTKKLKMPVYESFSKMDNTIQNKRSFEKCYMRYLVPNIGPDGYVYSCCELRGFEPIGNIRDHHLKDIWGSTKHKIILKYLDRYPNSCPACKYAAGNEIIEKFFINNLAHKEFL